MRRTASAISVNVSKPTSGKPSKLADVPKPPMNTVSSPADSISRAVNTSCAPRLRIAPGLDSNSRKRRVVVPMDTLNLLKFSKWQRDRGACTGAACNGFGEFHVGHACLEAGVANRRSLADGSDEIRLHLPVTGLVRRDGDFRQCLGQPWRVAPGAAGAPNAIRA